MQFTTIGAILGLTAGITPGPLLALVLSESLRHGAKAGMKVAAAPVLSDIPIVFLALYVLASLSRARTALGIISLLGGTLLLFLGIQNFRVKGLVLSPTESAPNSFTKGVVVNVLNPHPYLFWFAVGAPIANKALAQHDASIILFLGGFYGSFVGAKFVLAILTARSRKLINDKTYRYLMGFLGLILCGLAIIFFRDSLGYFSGKSLGH